ncbi:unnamed protein product [Adineta ricciae]|uniref:G-protein coupled receptors family 1 profile domain-containing protein n=1 Tax=Adineta ricciae TaxID=249248 RepID=A0A814QJ37_ADIRI|nr:unnamed protein product [Adineta ricciae]CAF1120550.1 unnamed protein product [Adineta ricciae]
MPPSMAIAQLTFSSVPRMSNPSNSSTTTVAAVTDLVLTKQILNVADRYIEVILYVSGVCGAFLNIFTFLQKQLRTNSCSWYFLVGSLCDLLICNIFILTKILSLYNPQSYGQFARTLFWCKFGNFSIFTFPCLSSLYITCASIDRFCSSSRRATWRKLSSIKVCRIVIPAIFVGWAIFSLHTVIAYDLRQFNPNSTTISCTPDRSVYTFFVIVDGFFFALFNGAIVPFFLALFGILIILHVRQSQKRAIVAPAVARQTVDLGSLSATGTTNGNPVRVISRANHSLIIMLLFQVSLTILLNLPYVVIYLNNLFKSTPATPFNAVLSYIATWFYYLNYCKTFYLNTMSSQLFRSILRQQVLYMFNRTRTQLIVAWSTSGQR